MNRQITLTVLLAAIVLAGVVAFLVFGNGTGDDGEVTATAGAEQAAQGQGIAPAETEPAEQPETEATEAVEPPAESEPAEAAEAPESEATESAEQAETAEAPDAEASAPEAETAEPAETEASATAEAPEAEPAPEAPQTAEGAAEAPQTAPAEAEAPAPAEQPAEQPTEQFATLPPPEDTPEIALPPAVPPSFDVVRVEPNGDAVIAGRAEPGSLVVLEADGEPLAEARADSAGDWIMILDWALGPGSHQLSLRATDSRGETLRAPTVVVVAVPERAPVAEAPTPSPEGETPEQAAAGAAPTEEAPAESEGAGQALAVAMPEQGGAASTLLQTPEGAGIADQELVLVAIEYDPDGQVIISGRARPGARVLLYIDNLPIGEATADEEGRWSLAPTAEVAPGLHRLRIDQLDDGGQVAARVETPFSRADALVELPADRFVVVQPGNSLWRIARRSYGDGVRYSVIYESNQSQIRDPDLIYPGQIFVVPEVN